MNPSAPFRIREAASSGSWWKGKGRASDADLLEAYGAQGRELVRVLSGEEELSALSTPKVSVMSLCMVFRRIREDRPTRMCADSIGDPDNRATG